jgi:hypothetical protein
MRVRTPSICSDSDTNPTLSPSGRGSQTQHHITRQVILSSYSVTITPGQAAGCGACGATPSFFCRLVDDVVYWNTKRFSG